MLSGINQFTGIPGNMAEHMAFSIIPDLKLILTYVEGRATLADVIKLNTRFLSDPAYDPAYDIIMDFRKSTALAFKMDIAEYFTFFRKNVKLPRRIKSGLLYSTPNHRFLISIYKPTAKLMKIDVGDFMDLEKCLDWMKYQPTEQLRIREALDALALR